MLQLIYIFFHDDPVWLHLQFDFLFLSLSFGMHIFKTDMWTVAFLCLSHPGLIEGLEVVVCSHFPFMAFRCVFLCVCVLLCLHAGYKAAWCLGPEICADQTLLDSSPTHTNRSLSLVFLAGQHPSTLYGAWLMWPPLKCWYKIRLPCSPVIQSLLMGINTSSNLYSVTVAHCQWLFLQTIPEKRRPDWLTLQHIPLFLVED